MARKSLLYKPFGHTVYFKNHIMYTKPFLPNEYQIYMHTDNWYVWTYRTDIHQRHLYEFTNKEDAVNFIKQIKRVGDLPKYDARKYMVY